jgi:MATE family multidrug resistance protein
MPLVRILTGLEAVRATASSFVGYAVALPAVAVWAFVWDGVFFGAARAGDLRNGMALACALLALLAALLVPPFGNHGLWTAFLVFLAARGLILWWLYRVRGAGAGFVVVPG